MPATGVQAGGGDPLGVRRVGGHHHVGQLQTVEQDRHLGRLAALGCDVDLGQHDTGVVVERRQ